MRNLRRALLGRPVLAALWTPALFGASLVAWFDAQTPASITQSNGTVSAWASRVGGYSATQATSGSQPGYSATARNGHPGLTFSGSQLLQFSADTASLPTSNGSWAVGAEAYNNGSSDYGGFFSYGANSDTHLRDCATNGGKAGVYYYASDYTSPATWSAADGIYTTQLDGANLSNRYLSLNGTTYDGAPDLGSGVNTSAGTTASVGATPGVGNWTGVIQEIVVVSRVLTTTERQQLEGYLAWRWGTQSLLPSGHPYKSVAP